MSRVQKLVSAQTVTATSSPNLPGFFESGLVSFTDVAFPLSHFASVKIPVVYNVFAGS